jgi:hypothetical protein
VRRVGISVASVGLGLSLCDCYFFEFFVEF